MDEHDDRAGRMDRRGFLGGVAAGATLGVAATTAGCAGALTGADLGTEPGEVERFCSLFDEGLPRIAQRSPIGESVGHDALARSPKARRYAERADPIARRALRSLHVAGAYGDLPEAGRADARVQRRMAEFAPEMDASVIEIQTLLSTMPEEERQKLGNALRDGDPAMRIAEVIDEEARAFDVSMRSRTKLRVAARNVDFRLSRQPPSLLIDEYVTKVDRVAANRGIDIVAQTQAAARVTEQMFWDAQRRNEGSRKPEGEGPEGGEQSSPPLPPGYSSQPGVYAPPPEPPAEEEKGSPGAGARITGAWMIGIGAIVFGIGGAVADAGTFAGVFVMTAGALGVVIGLIALVVGLFIWALSD